MIQNLTSDLEELDFTATKTLCPTVSIHGEYSKETELLRFFRDNILIKTPQGRALIKLYYQWSPIIMEAMEKDEGLKEEVKEMIDEIVPSIQMLVE